MFEQIKPKHIEQYIKKNYNVTLSTVQDDNILFEALSEKITELNPEKASSRHLAKGLKNKIRWKT